MSYQVPQHIADSKIFLAKFSEVQGGRLDPVYVYSTKHERIYNYASKSLNKLVSFATGGTPSKANPEYWNGNIFWVSAKDFKSFYIDSSEDTITELGLKKSSSKLIPQNSLLMVVRSGILLHTLPIAITKCPVAINQDVKALFVKDSQLNAQYLGYFFDVFNKYVLSKIVKHSTTVQSVNTNELERLEIPLPSLEIQKEIVSFMDDAYAQKQQKELQAKALLQSIDEYLLGELGIERPSPTRTENGRFFYTSHKEVTGKRLDPLAYSEQAKLLKQSITSGKYSCSTLKSLIIQEAAGDWGIDVIDDYDESIYSKCLVLRSTEFSLNHNIVVDNSKAKYRLISNRKLDSIDLQPNDLIIEKSGGSENQPVGRIAIITKDLYERDKLCYSNFVQKIRLDNSQAIPTYACFFLRLVHNMRLTETMQSQTNGIRNLILSEYYNQQIPIPPIEKQKEIIYHIGTLYNRVKQLQHEATTILSDAKQEIEQMILG